MVLTYSKTLSAFLTIVLLINPLCAAAPAQKQMLPMSTQEIGDLYMRSFGVSSENDAMAANAKKVDLVIAPLTRQEKLQRLFSLIGANEPKSVAGSLMDSGIRVLVKDIDALYGQGEDYQQHLMSRINLTSTALGEAGLAHMLTHPYSDVPFLKARQNLIKKLVTDDQFFATISGLVAQMTPQAESALFSFCVEENKPTKEQINNLFYGKALGVSFNSNCVALECLMRLQDLGSAAIMAVPAIVPSLMLYWGYKNGQREQEFYYAGIHPLIPNVEMAKKGIKNYYDPRMYIDSSNKMPGIATYAIIHGLQLLVAKKGFDRARQMHSTLTYLQERLMGVATLVNVLKNLQEVAASESKLKEGLSNKATLQELFDADSPVYSAEFKKLIVLLQTPTFTGQPSIFSSAGRILAAYTLMNSTKGELGKALQLFGELDACLSIAKLYKMFEHAQVHYCFADFAEADKPALSIAEFWNPIIDPQVVVTNDCELGGQNKTRAMVLTGSNTGGKSTIIKGMLDAALFAQTLTIAPASALRFTPFAYFGCSLNINDDTAQGYSLYQAEVNRAKMLVRAARSLKGNQFGFLVIDELFRGTSPEQAEQGSYSCAQEFLACDNAMVVFATHFARLTTGLEQETGGACKNYKVEVRKDEQGNIIRPFKLEAGVNNAHIAGQILESAMTVH